MSGKADRHFNELGIFVPIYMPVYYVLWRCNTISALPVSTTIIPYPKAVASPKKVQLITRELIRREVLVDLPCHPGSLADPSLASWQWQLALSPPHTIK